MRAPSVAFLPLLAFCAILASAPKADAQYFTYKVASACGSQSFTAGSFQYGIMDTTGKFCDSSGGGGGAVTIANGADVALGNTGDAAWSGSGAATAIAALKYIGLSINNPIPAGTNVIGKVGIDQTTDGTTNAVHLTAGTNLAGKFGIDQTTPGTTNGVSLVPTTGGGCTIAGIVTTASTNATSAKASAGTFCGGHAVNTTATLAYLRWYNLSAAPTCSSATGFVFSTPIPANAAGAGLLLDFGPYGAAFTTGIAWCVTGGGTSTDNTNAVAGVYINYAYK